MHYKLFYILSFTINYYYHNYIKILLYRYSMDGSTLYICRRDLFLLCLTSGSGWVCAAWLVYFVWSSWFRLIYWSTSSQVLIASSAQVPVSHLLLYDDSMFPHSSLSAGQTRLLDTSDVLLQMYCLRIYCRHAHLQRRALTDRTVLCYVLWGCDMLSHFSLDTM